MLSVQLSLKTIRFYVSLLALYAVTLGGAWYALQPAPQQTAYASNKVTSQAIDETTKAPQFVLVSGKPVRIVVASAGIDLAIDEGTYNDDGTWTLSDTNMQYAMMTVLANNHSGNTFLYGHGTAEVLEPLVAQPPVIGTEALVTTDNGHVFAYTFQHSKEIAPDDTSVFDYAGPPILTIQTCTGILSEWRTMFQFQFERVVQ